MVARHGTRPGRASATGPTCAVRRRPADAARARRRPRYGAAAASQPASRRRRTRRRVLQRGRARLTPRCRSDRGTGVPAARPRPTACSCGPGFGFDDVAAVADLPRGARRLARLPVADPAAAPGSARVRRGRPLPAQRRRRRRGRPSTGWSRRCTTRGPAGWSPTSCPTTWRCRPRSGSTPRCGACCATGPSSPYARWFDVDWAAHDRAVLMPVLGDRIGAVLGRRRDHGRRAPRRRAGAALLRPRVPGPPGHRGPAAASELVDRQWYRLALLAGRPTRSSTTAGSSTSTRWSALRVEDPAGLRRHARRCCSSWSRDGRGRRACGSTTPTAWPTRAATCAGWPRRPAAPGSSSRRSSRATSSCPPTGRAPGRRATTPCCASAACSSTRPRRRRSATCCTELTGEPTEFAAVVEQAKREVVEHGLYAEVNRLVDLLVAICHERHRAARPHPARLGRGVVELLVAFDRLPRLRRARASRRRPRASRSSTRAVEQARRAPARGRLGRARPRPRPRPRPPAGGAGGRADAARRAEFVVRFQQTCGPVMAKGVEDTAFYRWLRLVALNEVGGDPDAPRRAGRGVPRLCAARCSDWPAAMTTLSTHDTKRSRGRAGPARRCSPSCPQEWADAVRAWRDAAERAPLRRGLARRGHRVLHLADARRHLAGISEREPRCSRRTL